ncbi:MAG: glycosyltransferase [Promethearchaeia archaeon]
MNIIKVNFLVKLKEGPFGGGNQFLKALREIFKGKNIYCENPFKSDIILFNSYPFKEEFLFLLAFLLHLKKKIIIHRIDGPIFKTRNRDYEIDKLIYLFSKYFADGVIFQSEWSAKQNYKMGFQKKRYETIIHNAPNKTIFNLNGKGEYNPNKKIKLIAVSWSNNWMKGFKFYRFLDKYLDFSKYEMTFIGNSPIKFDNIKHIKPLPSIDLAKELKKHDIFITASRNDPCSNALLEALHCGLPVLAYNDGGHPELIGKGGEIFNGKEDLIEKLDLMVKNYNKYQENINISDIEEIARKYLEFMYKIYSDYKKCKYKIKKINLMGILKIFSLITFWHIKRGTILIFINTMFKFLLNFKRIMRN